MKKYAMLLPLCAIVLLTGCTNAKQELENRVLESSGITTDSAYEEYRKLAESKQLNEAGFYIDNQNLDEADVSFIETVGSIHVTFANNSYLSVQFFTDRELTERIDINRCYLNPGDSIYAAPAQSNNPNTKYYRLREYRVYEIDENGNRSKIASQPYAEDPNSTLLYQIPSDFQGTELSIAPIGEFLSRQIMAKAYQVDDAGRKITLHNAGSWELNGEEKDAESLEVGAVDDYTLSYQYDSEKYFFVTSDPAYFSQSDDEGYVEFRRVEASDDKDPTYEVELHPYLSLELKFDRETTVKINGGDAQTVKKGKTWSNNKLKYGDKITFDTNGECIIVSGDYRHVKAEKDTGNSVSCYKLTVVKKASDNAAEALTKEIFVTRKFEVEFADTCQHGICTFKLDGKAVTGKQELRDGQKLTVTYKITDDGYEFAGKASGVIGWVKSVVKSKERTETIEITSALDNMTIFADDYFDIVEKEVSDQ